MLSDYSVERIAKSLSVDSDLVFEKLSKIDKRERRMSYSLLKHMTSPINFVSNILKPIDPNAGMSFGSVVDSLITCPEKFEEEFQVSDISVSDGNQKDLATLILNGDKNVELEKRFNDSFNLVYKRGKPEDYTFILEYCRLRESGRKVITTEDYTKSKMIAENIMGDPKIEDILSQADGLQESLEFRYKGWDFKSVLDIRSIGNIYDLKFMSQLNPEKVHQEITKYGYDLQAGVYGKGIEILNMIQPTTKMHFIFYDKWFNYAVMEFTDEYMNYAQKKLEVYLNRLERIIDEDGWSRSYDFFNDNMKIYKPAYMKEFSEIDYKNL